MTLLRVTLPGAPRTKKTSNRLVRAGGRSVVLPSRAWAEWRDAVARVWPRGLAPQIAEPVNCQGPLAAFLSVTPRAGAAGAP